MWKEDLLDAINKFWALIDPITTVLKDIVPAVDGIVFHTTGGVSWKYWYKSRTVTRLEPWRKSTHTRSDIT